MGKSKAGSLPLSCPPSRFLSYPKIPLSGKVFVIDHEEKEFSGVCQYPFSNFRNFLIWLTMTESKAHIYQPAGDVTVEGPDTGHFLQGQFSRDLRVPGGSSVYGLWLDAKGKIKADSFLLKESENRFRAISYFSPTSFLQENLEKRIIMDEVATRSSDSPVAGISLWGEAIELGLEFLKIDRPEHEGFSAGPSGVAFWGRRSEEPSLEIIVDANESEVQDILNSLESRNIRILNTESVAVFAIQSKCFQVGKDVLEMDLPQEVGLGELAISYQKGCYIGQEVMARLNTMGTLRKSLLCVTVSKAPSGDAPWELLDDEGRKAGELRRVLETESNLIGSAMLKRSMDYIDSFSIGEQIDVKVSRRV